MNGRLYCAVARCAMRGLRFAQDHLANLGYIERLLEDPSTMAYAHAKKALLKLLVVLSLHSHIACDRFSRDGQ